jgi:tetraacyldisaccharide 4'-kinase
MLSYLYRIGVRLRNAAYDRGIFRVHHVDVPVVSVGNITAGGTGKTPVVEHLLAHFTARGLRPAVVTRGYRRSTRGLFVVSDGSGSRQGVRQSGDEASQIAGKFPHAVVVADEQRVRGCRHAATTFNADLILLDDAFQHRAVARDFDIAVVDAQVGIDRLRLLPAGRLREPLENLGRADAVLLSRCEGAEQAAQLKAGLAQWTSAAVFATRFVVNGFRRFAPSSSAAMTTVDAPDAMLSPAGLAGKRVLAFCGIGSPRAFALTLSEAGVDAAVFETFADHHWYAADDLRKLRAMADRADISMFVTTEKDAVRLRDVDGSAELTELWYPELRLEFIDGEEEFLTLLGDAVEASASDS